MSRVEFVADTSVLTRLSKPAMNAAVAPLVANGAIALTASVVFELGFTARNAQDRARLTDLSTAFAIAPTTAADHERALEVQGLLARHGHHRAVSLVDALVAAVAETRGLTVLHYDADFQLISDVTGQPNRWALPPGSVD